MIVHLLEIELKKIIRINDKLFLHSKRLDFKNL